MKQVIGQLKLVQLVLEHRQKRLVSTTTKLSRHYSTLRHTDAMLAFLEEMQGVCQQDPTNWDDEPDLVPF